MTKGQLLNRLDKYQYLSVCWGRFLMGSVNADFDERKLADEGRSGKFPTTAKLREK